MMELEPDKNLIDGNMKERDFSKRASNDFFRNFFNRFLFAAFFLESTDLSKWEYLFLVREKSHKTVVVGSYPSTVS